MEKSSPHLANQKAFLEGDASMLKPIRQKELNKERGRKWDKKVPGNRTSPVVWAKREMHIAC